MAQDFTGARTADDAAGNTWRHVPVAGAILLLLLISTQAPSVLAFTVPVPLLAAIAAELAHGAGGEYLVKLISGILGPAMAIGAPIGGLMADRLDRRWVLMGFGLVFALAGTAPMALDNLEAIVATRFLAGFSAAAMMATGLAMVGDYLPEEKRAGTIGLLSALNMGFSLLLLPVAGFLGDSSWRLPFALYLIGTLGIALAARQSLPAPAKAPVAIVQPGAAAARKGWLPDLPWGLLLLAFITGVLLTILAIYVSFHLATIGLGKMSTISLMMMINSAVATVFSGIYGRARKRISTGAVFIVGFGAMAMGNIILALAPSLLVVILAMLFNGVGMGWLTPNVLALAVDSVEEGQRGKVVGAIHGTMSVAPLIGLTVLEPAVPIIGTKGVFLLLGSLSAVLFVYFLVRRKT